MAEHIIYVYGTLRTRKAAELVEIQGSLYDLGWFPGVKLYDGCNTVVKCERRVVDDEQLAKFDRYEGFREESPESSFFVRTPVLDGEIYVYNHQVDPNRLIPSGDWLQYKQERAGM